MPLQFYVSTIFAAPELDAFYALELEDTRRICFHSAVRDSRRPLFHSMGHLTFGTILCWVAFFFCSCLRP